MAGFDKVVTSYEQAMQIAKEKEGSEFESIDDSDWEIYDLEAHNG